MARLAKSFNEMAASLQTQIRQLEDLSRGPAAVRLRRLARAAHPADDDPDGRRPHPRLAHRLRPRGRPARPSCCTTSSTGSRRCSPTCSRSAGSTQERRPSTPSSPTCAPPWPAPCESAQPLADRWGSTITVEPPDGRATPRSTPAGSSASCATSSSTRSSTARAARSTIAVAVNETRGGGHRARPRRRAAPGRGRAGVQPVLAGRPGSGPHHRRHRPRPGHLARGRPPARRLAAGVGRARRGLVLPAHPAAPGGRRRSSRRRCRCARTTSRAARGAREPARHPRRQNGASHRAASTRHTPTAPGRPTMRRRYAAALAVGGAARRQRVWRAVHQLGDPARAGGRLGAGERGAGGGQPGGPGFLAAAGGAGLHPGGRGQRRPVPGGPVLPRQRAAEHLATGLLGGRLRLRHRADLHPGQRQHRDGRSQRHRPHRRHGALPGAAAVLDREGDLPARAHRRRVADQPGARHLRHLAEPGRPRPVVRPVPHLLRVGRRPPAGARRPVAAARHRARHPARPLACWPACPTTSRERCAPTSPRAPGWRSTRSRSTPARPRWTCRPPSSATTPGSARTSARSSSPRSPRPRESSGSPSSSRVPTCRCPTATARSRACRSWASRVRPTPSSSRCSGWADAGPGGPGRRRRHR